MQGANKGIVKQGLGSRVSTNRRVSYMFYFPPCDSWNHLLTSDPPASNVYLTKGLS